MRTQLTDEPHTLDRPNQVHILHVVIEFFKQSLELGIIFIRLNRDIELQIEDKSETASTSNFDPLEAGLDSILVILRSCFQKKPRALSNSPGLSLVQKLTETLEASG